MAQPYLVLALLNVLGLCFAVWRFVHGPLDERGTVIVSSLWVLYNLLIIGGALAVAAEVQQVRRTHRVTTRLPMALQVPDGAPARRAAGLLQRWRGRRTRRRRTAGRRPARAGAAGAGSPRVRIPGARATHGRPATGLLLLFEDERQRVEFAQCTFARADAWLDWHAGYQPKSLPRSLWSVLVLGWRGSADG